MPFTGSGSSSGGRGSGGGRGGGRGSGGSGGGRGSSSRSYPRGVGPDFRKLTGLTLLQYIDHHGVPIRDDAPPSELAVAVARHFETLEVTEDDAVDAFLERLAAGNQAVDYGRRTAAWTTSRSTARRRRQYAARPGEQVAAKVTRTDENGSWILASVQKFYPDTETYDVQDEDDVSKLIRLPWTHVMQLSHSPAAPGATGAGAGAALPEQRWYTKNKECMAIFPETTSFYRAIVSKAPVWTWDEQRRCPVVQELVVKFEDDEDAAGRTPHRRVPSRYVIPLPAEYFHEESEDVDLSTTTTTTTTGAHHHHHNGATVNLGK